MAAAGHEHRPMMTFQGFLEIIGSVRLKRSYPGRAPMVVLPMTYYLMMVLAMARAKTRALRDVLSHQASMTTPALGPRLQSPDTELKGFCNCLIDDCIRSMIRL